MKETEERKSTKSSKNNNITSSSLFVVYANIVSSKLFSVIFFVVNPWVDDQHAMPLCSIF